MPMNMPRLLDTHDLILLEAAIVERLRRDGRIELHPHLIHAPLLYDEAGRQRLRAIYQGYVDIARAAGLPILLCTPTWRTNRSRVGESGLDSRVNRDAVRFLDELRSARDEAAPPIAIGGLVGCKNDCYRPQEALTSGEAERFHSWQIEELVESGVDFLFAETLPSVEEATGIARAMAATGVPYLLGFVIDRHGAVLDGTELPKAVATIDDEVAIGPLGFLVNCAHPSFLNADRQPPELFRRLIGYQANASSLDHAQLDEAEELQADDVADWGDAMLNLHRRHGVKILGGCCGTGDEHLTYLATNGRRTSG